MSDILASVSKLGGGRGGSVIELIKKNRGLLFPVGAIMVMLTFFVPLP
jgi:hypothetical protein